MPEVREERVAEPDKLDCRGDEREGDDIGRVAVSHVLTQGDNEVTVFAGQTNVSKPSRLRLLE